MVERKTQRKQKDLVDDGRNSCEKERRNAEVDHVYTLPLVLSVSNSTTIETSNTSCRHSLAVCGSKEGSEEEEEDTAHTAWKRQQGISDRLCYLPPLHSCPIQLTEVAFE
jgi:hypothetical protein